MPNFNAGFGYIGGAVEDLLGIGPSRAAAGGYRGAASLSRNDAALSVAATKVKETQLQREAYKVIGGQQSDVAGAGFAATGTALDLLRSSTQEAAAAIQLNDVQGMIEKNQFLAQATEYDTKAASEEANASGDIFGAIFKTVAAVGSFLI